MTHDELSRGYRRAGYLTNWLRPARPQPDIELLAAFGAAFIALIVVMLWMSPPTSDVATLIDMGLASPYAAR
jgi:hypothetical protein